MRLPGHCVLVVVALMVGCLFVAACEEEQLTPLEALLKTATLQAEDFPSGFTLDEERFRTTEQRAENDPIDPEDTLKKLNEWGHMLAYVVSYSKEVALDTPLGSITGYSVHVTIFQDADGARAAMAGLRERSEDPEVGEALWARSGLSEFSVSYPGLSRMPFADIGDETFATQMTATSPSLPPQKLDILEVVFREDRLIGGIGRVSVGSPLGEFPTTPTNGGSPVEQLEELARKLHERMEAALKEPLELSPTPPGGE